MSVLKEAYRALRGRFPAPFQRAAWFEMEGELVWTTDGGRGGLFTCFGLSPTNTELPRAFHMLASAKYPHAVRAYRLIELAHDARWYASAVFPNLARAILATPPEDRVLAQQLLLEAVGEFYSLAKEWEVFSVTQAELDRRRAAKQDGFRQVAKLNQERSLAAQEWRAHAIEIAEKHRRYGARESLLTLAHFIAEEFEEGRHPAKPSVNTIYQALRAHYVR